jgi:hypothetical protein
MTAPIGYFGNTLVPIFPPYHYTIPKFVWGDLLDQTLEVGAPLEGPPVSYSEPHDGNEMVQASDGADGFDTGYDQRLSAICPWIPMADDVTSYGIPVTGWYSTSGWHALIKWARSCNPFNFFPDRSTGTVISVHLIEPVTQRPDQGHRGGRRLPFVIQSVAGTRFEGY